MKEEPNRLLVCFFHSAILLVDQTITSASHLTRLLQNITANCCTSKHKDRLSPRCAFDKRAPLPACRAMPRLSTRCASLLCCCSSSARRGAPSAARHTSCCRAGCARLRCVEKQLECLPTEREAPSSPCSACEECCVEAMEGLRRSLRVLVEGAA